MSDCTHDCSTCGESCADRKNESPFQIKPLREGCRVGKVYGVVSGKGGVGQSMVTSQLAVSVQQFWGDTLWNDVDYMFVDMPPGTGDVALNVFQTLPVDGVIIVASPQDLVSMVVQKAVKMAQMMHIPIVGLVENMSYVQCPDCGKKLYIFGEGKTEEAAKEYGLPLLAKMPIDPQLAKLTDDGCIEQFEGHWLDGVVDAILKK